MLKRLDLNNFTVFERASLNFAHGLNVIVGENGSGKSHLLKIAYSVMAASAEEGKKPTAGKPVKKHFQKSLADKIIGVMRPEALGHLVRKNRCEVAVEFQDSRLDCSFSFSTSNKSSVQIDMLPSVWLEKAPVFLPTKELMTLYPNFISLYENHYMEFEETYRDTCRLLGALPLKGSIETTIKGLTGPLEEAMGGVVLLDNNGRFYLDIKGKGKMEMPLVAEGLRKLAMLSRLISTGSLLGEGYLFWDKPEADLNPRLIRLVAEVIYHLCQHGIQVFLATHSLFLLRELERFSKEEKFSNIQPRFFALMLKEGGVEVEQCTDIEKLEEHFTYMSDGFIAYESEEDDLDTVSSTVPSYDELTVRRQRSKVLDELVKQAQDLKMGYE